MKILIIDPHGLALDASQQRAASSSDDIFRSNGILETVWMLGVEMPQVIIVIQPPGPDVDWVKLSRCTCPAAHIVCLPVDGNQQEASHRLQELWQHLPRSMSYSAA